MGTPATDIEAPDLVGRARDHLHCYMGEHSKWYSSPGVRTGMVPSTASFSCMSRDLGCICSDEVLETGLIGCEGGGFVTCWRVCSYPLLPIPLELHGGWGWGRPEPLSCPGEWTRLCAGRGWPAAGAGVSLLLW